MLLALFAVARAASPSATGGVYAGYLWTPADNPIAGAETYVVRLGISLVPVLDVEVDVGRVEGKTRDLGIVYQMYTPRAHALFHLTPDKRFDVFLGIGGGLEEIQVFRDSEGDAPDLHDRALYRNPSQDLVVDAGPGLTMQIAGPLHLRTDFRWYGSFGQDDTRADSDTFQNWEWTIGVDLRRERLLDRDKDGIPDRFDDCPDDPEDEDGFQDDDGCPELDNDEDGIKDTRDDCPNEPEDHDGYEDRDGCPDPDNDRDGIRDKRDDCPDEPEDADGFRDDDGCPEPDNDLDGIVDRQDRCPDEPENDNNYQDNDGCPDELPLEIERFTGVIEGITFETNKAIIRRSSEPTLYEALGVLQRFPDVRILIEGHTDDVGKDAFNLDLSQRRAQSVVDWFVQNGIDPERLRAQGFGETRPRSDNTSDAGRAENRRVEFKILE